MSLLIFGLGTPEILLIFGAILLLFGGRKIPELMRGIGKGVREFNDAKQTVKDELEAGMKDKNTKEPS
jgi:sec-independent protein translocase protein TatA